MEIKKLTGKTTSLLNNRVIILPKELSENLNYDLYIETDEVINTKIIKDNKKINCRCGRELYRMETIYFCKYCFLALDNNKKELKLSLEQIKTIKNYFIELNKLKEEIKLFNNVCYNKKNNKKDDNNE